jgi:hypothetical protein
MINAHKRTVESIIVTSIKVYFTIFRKENDEGRFASDQCFVSFVVITNKPNNQPTKQTKNQPKNKQLNKQTNKQTNNQIYGAELFLSIFPQLVKKYPALYGTRGSLSHSKTPPPGLIMRQINPVHVPPLLRDTFQY